jgi:hypothetical protein
LFSLAGYQVERFPRTGSADVDPLLTRLDLLAQKGEHTVFVGVEAETPSGEPVDWKTGTELTMASWSLSQARELSPERAERLLVLVDVKADKSLQRLQREGNVEVARLTSQQIEQVLSGDLIGPEREVAAWKLLKLPDESADVADRPAQDSGEQT